MGDSSKEKKTQDAELTSPVERSMTIRLTVVAAGISLFFGLLVYMLYVYQIRDHQKYRALAEAQQTSDELIAPARGNIYDANGTLLAQSATVWNVVASPHDINKAKTDVVVLAQMLAEILELDPETLQEKLTKKKSEDAYSTYQLLKRKVEKPVADEIIKRIQEYNTDIKENKRTDRKPIRGIALVEDSKRYYPYGNFASTVIGYVNADGNGVNGIEHYYNDVLKGTPGRLVVPQNAMGNDLPHTEYETKYDPINGNNLVLTIDRTVQSILEKQVQTMVELNNVKERAVGIVMDVKTGAILGMTTKPDYNLNDPNEIIDPQALAQIEAIADEQQRKDAYDTELWAQRRNKAVSDIYYPGSVFKIITAAMALDSGKASVQTTFGCTGKITVAGHVIGCAGQHTQKGITALDFYMGLNYSCNPYFVQLAQQMGAQTFSDYLNAFGFNEKTGIDMDDEAQSQTISLKNMGIVELSSSAFGQSTAVTPIAMLAAASAAINGGKLMVPYVVQQVLDQDGNVVKNIEPQVKRQVISEDISRTIALMLEQSVATGHGNNAYVAGYRIGGKSGTSQKNQSIQGDDGGQTYVASFFAFAPADDPQIAVLLMADTPKREDGNTFGGRICGPYAGKIMREVLPYLNISREYGDDEADFAEISLPDVTGKLVDEAMIQLNKSGDFNGEVIGGGTSVVAQYPSPGQKLVSGSAIMLYTEPGAEQPTVTVPNLTDKTVGEVEKTLKALKLNLMPIGSVKQDPEVRSISQSLPEGTVLPAGAVIEVEFQDHSLRD